MNYKKITLIVTAIVIPSIIIAILIYDAIAVVNGGSEASISALIIKLSYEMPFLVSIISWFAGLLQGHLFWRMKPNKMTEKIDKEK